MNHNLASIRINNERDIVLARQQARRIAEAFDFEVVERSRISTATSEIARDLILHTNGGQIDFQIHNDSSVTKFDVIVRANDKAAIEDIIAVIEGRSNRTEFGNGFINATRLMGQFSLRRNVEGPETVVTKAISRSVTNSEIKKAMKQSGSVSESTSGEFHEVNQELIRTIDTLHQRQLENRQLTSELEETNRGVLALYAELDEKAESLKKADQLKSRFLSHMSHEFRTPLSSILGLAKLLLNRTDGDLTVEQEKQVKFILNAAQGLLEVVNDLLDLAKIEAGKTEIHTSDFSVSEFFGALRGMFRPILANPHVQLIFKEEEGLPSMHTDEPKLSQIIRNFISNALKFTETGEVRVTAELHGDEILFSVEDTGIGIALEHQKSLFQEFAQLDSPLHRKTKGTGLGLALCKKLAELLGGRVGFTSELGTGSKFYTYVPIIYGERRAERTELIPPQFAWANVKTILIVDDDEASRYLIKSWFAGTNFALVEAASAVEGLKITNTMLPDLVILDLNMPGMNGFEFLRIIKNDPEMSHIPVIVNTSKVLEDNEQRFLKTRAAAVLSKATTTPQHALEMVNTTLNGQTESR